MIKSQERVQSRRLSGVVLLALALATLVSFLVIFPSRSASALPSPGADYRFQNRLTTSVGTAPALTKLGPSSNTFTTAMVDGSSRTVLRFPEGNGLKLSPTMGVVPNNTYTIVVLFELNEIGDDVSRFRRILDFKNGTSDSGLYVENGRLSFYRQGLGAIQGPASIHANRYVQVVVTRDASGMVRGYVDGAEQFSFDDSVSQSAVISGENTLRFFKDDTIEHSAGSVARIRLFGSALSGTEVGELDRLEPTIFTVNSNADLADGNLVDGKCQTVNTNQCTLRAAVQQTNRTSGNDAINFALGSSSSTIILTQGHISIDSEPDSLTINGPKPKPGVRILTVSVSANNPSRAFFISDDATTVINRLRITNGKVTTDGGGISNGGDSLTLTNSTVSGNSADGEGGGIFNEGPSSDLTLRNSTVSGNTSKEGGGIYNEADSLTLTNSTVSGNNASIDGGGIYNIRSTIGGTMMLTNSTVSNNTAGDGGGGIFNNGGTAILLNTIVAGNFADSSLDARGSFSGQDNNLIGNTNGASGFGGSDVLGKNPHLGPLQDNGGATDTHALLSGSPAVDRGSNTNCPATDQRGVSRPRDGDGNGTVRCDIGSYEKK
jgi:hypothetical protein